LVRRLDFILSRQNTFDIEHKCKDGEAKGQSRSTASRIGGSCSWMKMVVAESSSNNYYLYLSFWTILIGRF
jgi:hypothetical protein